MRGIVVLAAALVLLSTGAAAAPRKKSAPVGDGPMQVHLVRSAHPDCEPECPQWIAAQGRIMPGTAQKFRKLLRELGNRKLPIFVDSMGGALHDGMAIGRLVRAKDLTVAVTATTFSPCAPEDRGCRKAERRGEKRGVAQPYLSKCASACVFILAGGTRRLVGEGALVGVHQGVKIQRMYWVRQKRGYDGSIRTTKTLAWEGKSALDRKTNTDMRKFLTEMGMGDMLMRLIESTPNESIRRLSGWELQATALATDYLNGQQLLAGTPAPPFPRPPVLWSITPPAPSPSPSPPSAPGPPASEIGNIQDVCLKLGRCEKDGIKTVPFRPPGSR
jgi:hypothetical protein